LPLVNRMARALGGWLGPAWGDDLRLAPDLDQVEALTPEREALWARIGAADFLSEEEKRAAVGYGDAEEGGDRASSPFARKYRPDQARDDRGRWVEEGGGADEEGEEGEPESGEHEPPREPDEFDEEEGQDPLLHRVSRRGPGQSGNPRLDAAFHDARQAVRQTRELDPNWQAPRSFTSRDNIDGQIAHYEAVARAAQARYAEITRDSIPGTNPSWSAGRLRDELRERGFEFTRPTDTQGIHLRNPQTRDEVRIMQRPDREPYRNESPLKFNFGNYYRYKPYGSRWGAHIPVPD
jgi:hypothetical protein